MKHLVVVFVAILFLTAPAQAKDKLLDIREVKSPGGLSAWLVEDHSVPVIAMEVSFRGAGTAGDLPDKQGLARMASNTMDEGAGSLSAKEFQKELRDLVIDLHFSAGRDDFGASLKTLAKNKDRAFELLKLALTKPRFDKDAVERMRKANQSRIRASLSDPQWLAARILNDKAFAGHPYAMNSGGTLSSLEKITPADLKKFHETRIGKNNLLVAVAGDITPDELSGLMDKLFGNLPEVTLGEPEDLEIRNGGKIFLYKRDIPQTVVEMIQPGIARTDPDFYKAQIMNFILGSSGFGSRLTEEIREKRGLTYGIYSYLYQFNHMNALAISTSTVNKSVPEILDLTRTEMTKMRDERITKEELRDAKSYLTGSVPLSLTSTDKIAALLLSLQLDGLPIDYLDRREAAINAATIEDVQAVARRILGPEKLTTVLVGDAKPDGVETVKNLPNVE